MEYKFDYEENTIEELEEIYQKNITKINYYNNKIKHNEKYEMLFGGIMLLASWIFGGLGIYFSIKNEILQTILFNIFIVSNVMIYEQVDFDKEDNERIQYFKNENEKIELVLKFKRDRN